MMSCLYAIESAYKESPVSELCNSWRWNYNMKHGKNIWMEDFSRDFFPSFLYNVLFFLSY